MSTQYVLKYTETRDLLARAMTSWAKPKPSLKGQILRWGGCVLGGVLLGLTLSFSGLFEVTPPGFWTGAIVGFYIALFFGLVMHRFYINKLSKFALDFADRAGPVTATLDEKGARFKTEISNGWQAWHCFDQVIEMKDATVLRAGALVYPLPDDALPQGTRPEDFRSWLRTHIEGAA